MIVMENGYTLPNCTATAENYHVKNGSRLTSYTIDTVAALLKAQPNGAHVFVVGNGADFQNWFQTNVKEIAKKAGVTQSFSYSMVNIGNEFCVWITPA